MPLQENNVKCMLWLNMDLQATIDLHILKMFFNPHVNYPNTNVSFLFFEHFPHQYIVEINRTYKHIAVLYIDDLYTR
jgi:hypothetical protein